MWVRGIAGIVLVLVGAVWIAQGLGSMNGSVMSGHRQYAVLGAVVAVAGIGLIVWAGRVRRAKTHREG